MMGDKATLRMAQQELEDLYRGVPDDSVDLTFKDLASPSSSTFVAATRSSNSSSAPLPHVAAVAGDADDDERKTNNINKTGGLARSSTNIFTYRPLEDREDMDPGLAGLDQGLGGVILQLSSSSSPAVAAAATTTRSAAVANRERRSRRMAADDGHQHDNRPGIPHSNICTLCNKYIYIFRHRCLVCGRVYCQRCVGSGMGDMAEGRKCIDCLGRRYSQRYIHRAGDTSGCCLCFWGYYPSAKAVTAQELVWAEKGPAPRRRPRHRFSSVSTSYDGVGYYSSTNTIASTSMSCDSFTAKMNGNSISGMPPASASSSFVASYAPNPHAFPL